MLAGTFVVDGNAFICINMCLRAYVWCFFDANVHIGGVRAVESGLIFFFGVCVRFLTPAVSCTV